MDSPVEEIIPDLLLCAITFENYYNLLSSFRVFRVFIGPNFQEKRE